MQALTVERRRTNHANRSATMVAYAGAVAFAIAAVWFWLAIKGVTVSAAPRIGPGVPAQQAMRIHYRWQATTLQQERFYTSIAIVGFLCLAAASSYLQYLLGRDQAIARIGALMVGGGSLLWIAGNVTVLGGHRAVGLMAAHTNPIEVTNSLAFTIDTIGQAFEVAALALIGAGMLGLATALPRPGHRAWLGCATASALVILVTAGAFAIGSDNFSDLMLLVSGVLALPTWLIWTGRAGRLQQQPSTRAGSGRPR
jgi:hypothetical protein